MTDPRVFHRCQCGASTSDQLARACGELRCSSCGAELYPVAAVVAVERQAAVLVDPPVPCPLLTGRIINRVVFKSRSLRRAEQAAGNPSIQ